MRVRGRRFLFRLLFRNLALISRGLFAVIWLYQLMLISPSQWCLGFRYVNCKDFCIRICMLQKHAITSERIWREKCGTIPIHELMNLQGSCVAWCGMIITPLVPVSSLLPNPPTRRFSSGRWAWVRIGDFFFDFFSEIWPS